MKSMMKAVVVSAALVCGVAESVWATEWIISGTTLSTTGGWKFKNCAVSDAKITLGRSWDVTKGTETTLDFNDPIIDAGGTVYSVIDLSDSLNGNTTLTDGIYLPRTLTSVGGYKMQNVTAPIYFPDVLEDVAIAANAFPNANIVTKVTLGDNATAGDAAFAGSKIPDVELGKNVKNAGLFANCKSLTNFISHATELSINAWKMQNCTALKEYHFACYPTLQGNWNGGSKTGTGVRTFVPEKNDQWKAVIEGTGFTPWAGCSTAQTNAYIAAFGADATVPLGYTTSPYATWLLYEPSQGGSSLTIEASPKQLGAVEPDYGVTEGLTATTPCSVTVSYAQDGDTLLQAKGWTFDIWQDGWSPQDRGEGTSYVFTPAGMESFRLTWQWEPVAYRVKLVGVPAFASVTVGTEPDLQGNYSIGSPYSATANGEGFVRWAGVPADVDASQRTISFVVSNAVTVSPLYAVGWTYGNGYISNGDWSFPVTLDGTRITIGTYNPVVGSGRYLDFSTPVTDAAGNDYSIVDMGGYFNAGNAANFAYGVVFAKTVECAGDWKFQKCSSPITIPDGNCLKSIGSGAFSEANLVGAVKLLKLESLAGSAFSGSSIRSVEFGKGLTSIVGLAGCKSLTNFVSRAKELRIGDWQMENCTVLREYRFACYPSLAASWNAGSPTGTGVRTFVPRGNAGWRAKMNAATFTTWASCSTAQTSAYFAAFGADAEIPKGYTTSPYATWLLEYDDGAGLKLLFR